MGMADPFAGDLPWEKKVKLLSDEDLMDMWADSQVLESTLDVHVPGHDFPGNEFEQIIIHELTLRTGIRLCNCQHSPK